MCKFVSALLQLRLLTKKPNEQPHAHMQIPHTWLPFLSLNTVETCDASSSPAVPVWHTHPLALAQLAQVAQLGMLGAAIGRGILGPLAWELVELAELLELVELLVAAARWQVGGEEKLVEQAV